MFIFCILVIDETIIEHFTSLEKGIESSNVDDRIVIYPGHYNVGSFVFKHSLSATGNGNVIGKCIIIQY